MEEVLSQPSGKSESGEEDSGSNAQTSDSIPNPARYTYSSSRPATPRILPKIPVPTIQTEPLRVSTDQVAITDSGVVGELELDGKEDSVQLDWEPEFVGTTDPSLIDRNGVNELGDSHENLVKTTEDAFGSNPLDYRQKELLGKTENEFTFRGGGVSLPLSTSFLGDNDVKKKNVSCKANEKNADHSVYSMSIANHSAVIGSARAQEMGVTDGTEPLEASAVTAVDSQQQKSVIVHSREVCDTSISSADKNSRVKDLEFELQDAIHSSLRNVFREKELSKYNASEHGGARVASANPGASLAPPIPTKKPVIISGDFDNCVGGGINSGRSVPDQDTRQLDSLWQAQGMKA